MEYFVVHSPLDIKMSKEYCACLASKANKINTTMECPICHREKKKSKLVAMCGWKYEPEWMIEEMKQNLNWVDEFVILDCRDRDELWIHEGEYRIRLREMAREKKADWVLVCAPDERYEKRAGEIIRPLIDYSNEDKVYSFKMRELFRPMWYRIDGIWGNKGRDRLYPLKDTQKMSYMPIQSPPTPAGGLERVAVDVNIYHLKMIEPQNRSLRSKVFEKLDPKHIYQSIGYDYLDNEREAVMERIPSGREYFPEYRKYEFKVPEKYLKVDETICSPQSKTE